MQSVNVLAKLAQGSLGVCATCAAASCTHRSQARSVRRTQSLLRELRTLAHTGQDSEQSAGAQRQARRAVESRPCCTAGKRCPYSGAPQPHKTFQLALALLHPSCDIPGPARAPDGGCPAQSQLRGARARSRCPAPCLPAGALCQLRLSVHKAAAPLSLGCHGGQMLPRAPRQVHTIDRADTQTDTPGQLCTGKSTHSWSHACESTVAHPGRPSRRVRRAYRHRRRAPGAAPLRAHHRIAPGQQPQPRARARPRQDIKVAHHGAARAEARPSAPGAAAARPAAAAHGAPAVRTRLRAQARSAWAPGSGKLCSGLPPARWGVVRSGSACRACACACAQQGRQSASVICSQARKAGAHVHHHLCAAS